VFVAYKNKQFHTDHLICDKMPVLFISSSSSA